MNIRRGLSGSTIKMIAIVTMFIDHLAAGVLGRYLIHAMGMGVDVIYVGSWAWRYETMYMVYQVMRFIGRIAFPIFCFLLIEGFEHTRNVKKYALRMFLFCLISEVPFDLLFNSSILEFGYQNVFFTLFIGLLTMWGFKTASEWDCHWLVAVILDVVVVLSGIAAAELLATDYGGIGVVCIMILYVTRNRKPVQILTGCISFAWELTAPLAFIPIGLYNGKRGLNMKYFFYFFYPVHLLLIYFLCMGLGIASYPAP